MFEFADRDLVPAPDLVRGVTTKLEENASKGIPWGIDFLDDITRLILPTDLVVLLSGTGVGKTTLVTNLAHAAAKSGLRVGFFALEAFHREIQARMVYREIAAMAHRNSAPGRDSLSYADWITGRCKGLSDQYKNKAEKTIAEDTKTLRMFYRDGEFTVDKFREVFRAAQDELDVIFLDHLHFIDLLGTNENDGLKLVIRTISDLVRDFEVPVILTAQTRKKSNGNKTLIPTKEDLHGSSEVMRTTTRLISFGRHWQEEVRGSGLCPTLVRVEKDRIVGDTPYTALLEFDFRTGGYRPKYRLGRLSYDGSEWSELQSMEVPNWARRAKKGMLYA